MLAVCVPAALLCLSSQRPLLLSMDARLCCLICLGASLLTQLRAVAALPFLCLAWQFGRPFYNSTVSVYGSIALVQRVENYDRAFISQWEANETARMGFPVHVLSSLTAPRLWLVADVTPRNPISLPFVGVDLGISADNLSGMDQLLALSQAQPSSTRQEQLIVCTGLFFYPATTNPGIGFSMFATVYDDDPTRVILASGMKVDRYVDEVGSRYAGVIVTDPAGTSTSSDDCTLADADQVLSREVVAAGNSTWRVNILQCPEYTSHAVDKSPLWQSMNVYMSTIVIVTVLSVAGVLVYMKLLSEKEELVDRDEQLKWEVVVPAGRYGEWPPSVGLHVDRTVTLELMSCDCPWAHVFLLISPTTATVPLCRGAPGCGRSIDHTSIVCRCRYGYCRKLLTFCTLQTALVDRPMSRGVGVVSRGASRPTRRLRDGKSSSHTSTSPLLLYAALFSAASGVHCAELRHGQNDNCVQFKGRLAHCPRYGHGTHRNQQVAISIHDAVLEYGIASGERPAYLKPEDKAAWQWQVSEVRAGR
jgi:hypothetical protein